MTGVQLLSIGISASLYFSLFYLNDWLFSSMELHSGANWIFLPAGVRLLCTLLFAGEGAIGLLLASIAIAMVGGSISSDWITALGAACVSAGAPYLAYRLALRSGLPDTLERLTAGGLSLLAVGYAFANASLHSAWFAWRDHFPSFWQGFTTMFIGDLIGTLLMVYTMKLVLALVSRRRLTD